MAPILTRVGQSFGFGSAPAGGASGPVEPGGHEASGGYKSCLLYTSDAADE